MTDIQELARDMMDDLALINAENERHREPPLGIDGLIDWYEHTGRIPADVDREDLRTLMDCYL